MRWEFKVDTRRFNQLLREYPRQLAGAMREAMHKALLHFRDVFHRSSLSGRPGLHRRTGDLLRSFKVGVSGSGRLSSLMAWLASRSRYAGIHETGGTVRSNRPGGYLAIPLPGALTKAGVLRGALIPGSIQEAAGFRQSLRSIKGLFVAELGGTPFLCTKRGKGIVPLFVLKQSVYIPPRLRLFEQFRRWIEKPRFQRFFRNAVTKTWNKMRSKS